MLGGDSKQASANSEHWIEARERSKVADTGKDFYTFYKVLDIEKLYSYQLTE